MTDTFQQALHTAATSGPALGGSTGFEDPYDPRRSWSPPNITSDAATGRLAGFTEDTFVARFRTGRVIPGSPMPWEGYRRMAEDDLRALYRYLRTAPPVKRDVGPPYVDRR